MIIQPERGTRNVNANFYEMETRQIAMLNEIFGGCRSDKERNADVGMACRMGGKHSGKYGIRNTKSDSGGSKAAITAAPSIGRKRSTLRFGRCRTDVPRTSCTPGRAQRQLLMDGTTVKSAFEFTFGYFRRK